MSRPESMPPAEKEAIIKARLAGASIREMRQQFGLSFNEACWFSQRYDANPARFAAKCVYPNIAEWIVKNSITQKELSYRTGVGYRALFRCLYGRTPNPCANTIRAILDVTGMDYQTAFYKEDHHEK